MGKIILFFLLGSPALSPAQESYLPDIRIIKPRPSAPEQQADLNDRRTSSKPLAQVPLGPLLNRYQKPATIFQMPTGEKLYLSIVHTLNYANQACNEGLKVDICKYDRLFLMLTYEGNLGHAAVIKALDYAHKPIVGGRTALVTIAGKTYEFYVDVNTADNYLSSRVILKSEGGRPDPQPKSFGIKELMEAVYQTGYPIDGMDRPYRLMYVNPLVQSKNSDGTHSAAYLPSWSLAFIYREGFEMKSRILPMETVIQSGGAPIPLDNKVPSSPRYRFFILPDNILEIYPAD